VATDTGDRLLAALRVRDGVFVSGTALAVELKVSRTAVWKWIHTLVESGYGIESRPRRGYRLVHPPTALHPREVAARLKSRWLGRPTVVMDAIDSTNRGALSDPALGHGAVLAAHRQEAGRGRLGRVWSTPPGTLPFSLVLAPPLRPEWAPRLTLATAVGLVEGIDRATGIGLDIKWPNDLLWEGRKVAGILTEVRSDPDRIVRAVVGVGLNVNTHRGDFDPELAHRATSLAAIGGRDLAPAPLLCQILESLERVYMEMWGEADGSGFGHVMARYREHLVTVGKRVTVSGHATAPYAGRAEGVDDDGGLTVVTDAGRRIRVLSGDVTLSATGSGNP